MITVTFTKPLVPYNPGESASFDEDKARRLIDGRYAVIKDLEQNSEVLTESKTELVSDMTPDQIALDEQESIAPPSIVSRRRK